VVCGTGHDYAGRRYNPTRVLTPLTIAMRRIKNCTELDFRSLGSYIHADLEQFGAALDAFSHRAHSSRGPFSVAC